MLAAANKTAQSVGTIKTIVLIMFLLQIAGVAVFVLLFLVSMANTKSY